MFSILSHLRNTWFRRLLESRASHLRQWRRISPAERERRRWWSSRARRAIVAAAAGLAVAAGGTVAGTWLGGLVGGAILGGGFFIAPEVSGRLERRAAARDRLDRVSAPAAEPVLLASAGPVSLLRPDRQVVAFVARPELAWIEEWCDEPGRAQVMLLTGAAGVGKTRLAVELAQRREASGWMCRSVRPGEESGAVSAVRAVTSKPVLLIVDYAETRQDLEGLLRETGDEGGDHVRVLLLARSAGEWLAQLQASTDATIRSLAAAAGQIRIGPTIAGEADVAGLVRSAAEAFADALEVTMPGLPQVSAPRRPASILVLHAAALLAVLTARDGQQHDPVLVNVNDQVLDELLAREKVFWLGSARTSQLTGPGGVDSVVAAHAVAVACLIAAADEPAAARALLRIPSLADAPASLRHKIARWLRQIYPADQPGLAGAARRWWGSLEPDLLAERHVVAQLAAAPDLASRCLRDLSTDQARAALTVLTRACAHEKDAPSLLAAALRADLANLAVPAVNVAAQTGGPLGQLLADVLADAVVPMDQLIMIHEAIPYPTLMLAAADAVVTQRITDGLDDDTPKEDLARWNDVLSSRLAQAGRSADALPPAQAAVDIYRDLAEAAQGRHDAELAAALSDLAIRLYRLGRLRDAAAAGEEAVAIRRELAGHEPDQFLPDLAISLSNLGAVFAELGKPSEAIALAEESVGIHRQLAQASPGLFMPDLAASLTNFAALSARLGRAEDARSAAGESAAIYLTLASTSPDRFLPDLASSLTNFAALLADQGHLAEALDPSKHAVATYRRLAGISPQRYRPEFAASLTNLGTQLSELGRPADALAHCQEAVAIRRDLADLTPDGNRSELAAALSNLAVCLAGAGRPQDALPPTAEAVGIYTALAADNPDRYRPDLALALANLGIRLADLAHPLDALAVTTQAVTIYRELAKANPARYRAELAGALGDLALRFSALGKPTGALIVSQEAVRIHRDLASRHPIPYLPRLATSLTNLGAILADLRRMTAALTTTEEALGIHQELAEAQPDYYRAERASTLANLSRYRSALGHPADALKPAREAVTIYRELEELTPRFRSYLAISLDILAGISSSLGLTAEAETARAQAAEIRSRPNNI